MPAETLNKRGPNGEIYGSTLLVALDDANVSTELTDAATDSEVIVPTQHVGTLVIDVISDKGGTLTITPLPNANDTSVAGEASTVGTLADSGPSKRFKYTMPAAPLCKVTFSKTEAGTSSGFLMSVRGTN